MVVLAMRNVWNVHCSLYSILEHLKDCGKNPSTPLKLHLRDAIKGLCGALTIVMQPLSYTLGWSDMALFAIFENGHIAQKFENSF